MDAAFLGGAGEHNQRLTRIVSGRG
jgi:hypothetical protein